MTRTRIIAALGALALWPLSASATGTGVFLSAWADRPLTCEPGQPMIVTDASGVACGGGGSDRVWCFCNTAGNGWALSPGLGDMVDDTEIAAGAVDGGSGGEIADGTVDGEDMAASYAGAHLAETAGSPDTLGVEAQLSRDSKCIWFEDPAVEDLDGLHQFSFAATVDRVWCETDTGTATLNIERDDGTPADILSSDIVCDSNEQTSCSAGCDVNTIAAAEDNIAQYEEINVSVSAVASTPGRVGICVHFTIDDI